MNASWTRSSESSQTSRQSPSVSLKLSLGQRARSRLERLQQTSGSTEYDLQGFIPRTSPRFSAPRHLQPLVDVLRRAYDSADGKSGPVFALVSEPPQHGKTETLLHGLAHHLQLRPQDPLAYVSYGDEIARDKSRLARDYARLSGVDIRTDSDSVRTWTTTSGGGLMARGIVGGAITGQAGLRLIVVDDPFKNRAEAESRRIRDKVYAEFSSSIVSRLHPNTSIVVNHTRWHEDDLIGRLLKSEPDKWEHINLPALDDDGEALWPEGQPAEHLESIRRTIGEYDWWSLYMGSPRPRGGKPFEGVAFYDSAPHDMKVAVGVDLAYSEKTSSDWSVAVALGMHAGKYYVLDVLRRQCRAEDFVNDLRAFHARFPGPMLWYAYGPEKGTAGFFQRAGVPLRVEQVPGDKFVRALPVTAAWSDGRVLMPSSADYKHGSKWSSFLTTVQDFTGLDDPHDDDVDALVAAYDQLQKHGAEIYRPPGQEHAPPPRRVAGQWTRRVGWGRGGAW